MKQICFFLLLIYPITVFSQTRTYLSERTAKAPYIDGQLTDDCWLNASWTGYFVQYEPNSGDAPSQPTLFAVAYDDNNLYVAIKSLDDEPDKIVRRISRRDVADGDWVSVSIDSYEDKITAFVFQVSASGSKGDMLKTEAGGEDSSWNPIWEVKTSMQSDGWYAEMRIPYSQLRFGKKQDYRWGFEVARFIYRNHEMSLWQPIDKASAKFIGNFGTLEGIHSISPRKDIEIVPFGLTQLTLSEKEDGNPFATGHRTTASVGVDGKIALTNDITLNFTVNPDFGQVEADPSVVNLTNFETYFDEKRPFFVEGSNIFHYPYDITNNERNKLFYSRRLGREPHLQYDITDDEFVREPFRTTILGATKVSGKTRNGTSIGILNAVTKKMYSEIDRDGVQSKYAVEPLTNYFVGRIEQDLDSGNMIVGAMLTATNRKIDEHQFRVLADEAYTGGANFSKYWKDKSYYVTARAFYSHSGGSAEAIARLQQSSARYYQRPDAHHVELDTTRTSLDGYGASVNGGKVSGHFNFMYFSSLSSPGLELNDVGFKPTSDFVMNGFWMAYRDWRPKGIMNEYQINGDIFAIHNFSGERLGTGIEQNGYIIFKNYYELSEGFNYQFNQLSTTLLRGGPAIKLPADFNYWVELSSDSRKKFQAEINFSGNIGAENSADGIEYGLHLTYKPNNRLSVSVNPEYSIFTDRQQFVRMTQEPAPTYVLSTICKHAASMSVRINYGITPDMSLQWYALPYLFSGDYSDFKTVVNPRADRFEDRFRRMEQYPYDNPDFHFLQFRSNLVYRWEYRPGSVLYLVWSQGRTVHDVGGSFRFGDYFGDLFHSVPQNDFLLKVSYAWTF